MTKANDNKATKQGLLIMLISVQRRNPSMGINYDNGSGPKPGKSSKLLKAKSKKGKMTVKVKGTPQAVRSTLASFTPATGNMETGS